MKLRSALWMSALCAVLSVPAAAQQSVTTTTRTNVNGQIVSVGGNRVLVKEADGLHEYTVPEGFKFHSANGMIGVGDLQPGMNVDATITDRTTVKDVVTTENVSGTVAQVAPGGIVVKTANNELKSYNFKDENGNDLRMNFNGKDVSLRDVKVGDRLSGTIVTKYGPQSTTVRSATAAVSTPAPPPAADTTPPPAVAVATPARSRRLPHTASPLPLVGVLAGLSLLAALGLRAARIR
jgi:hypothetical protein